MCELSLARISLLLLLFFYSLSTSASLRLPPSNAQSHQRNCTCLHNGVCVTGQDGAINCECPEEWFGPECERKRCASVHNPCLNQAICEKTDNSFYCHCPIGFGGKYCENQLPTICDTSNPCSPHGTCRITGSVHTYTCDCHFGFVGTNCTEENFCQDDPCLNGHCENGANGYMCNCREGWEGENCETDIDECQRDQPCVNGKCVNTIGSYYCECPLAFAGERCERRHEAFNCNPNPCLNGGACDSDLFSGRSFECRCPDGFEGERCEHHVDDCRTGRLTCINGGVCIRAGWDGMTTVGKGNWAEARCKCPSGFTGEYCEEDVNECEEWSGGLCQNGATCYNEHGTYSCLCVGGFTGQHCETNIDDCVDNLCYAGSTCVDGISRYLCMCTPDRIGNLCEFPNPCYSNPCKHAGRCFADPNNHTTYTCQCPDGFKGQNCDEDIDECAESPCFNGQCVNTYGSFQCTCDIGYDPEDNCMTPIKYCDSNPCVNGATCLNDLGKYHCLCLPGYSGKNCEVRVYQEVNKCYLDCKNGGICKNASANRCECPPPYAGILCELEKRSPCTRNDCHESSTCVPNEDYVSYSCQCPPHLSGQRCENKLRPCDDFNPCLHGTCHRLANGTDLNEGLEFNCECHKDFTGTLCDRKLVDRCQQPSNPCLNGGICQNRANGFFECECLSGFVGLLCEEPINANDTSTSTSAFSTITTPAVPVVDCRQKACRNGGKCSGDKEKFQCKCIPGFSGMFCEEDVNECLTTTCENKGRCVDLVNGFRCDCAPGWSGDRCEKNADDCAKIVCANGGTCIDGINDFRCECTRGYVGRYCEVYVAVDKFNGTDRADIDKCQRSQCQFLAGNGHCDAECNFYACNFDGGDCSAETPEPFKQCPQPSYCAHVFRDGVCDEICNSEKCLFDGFDCTGQLKNRTTNHCPKLDFCQKHYGNGRCDAECNVAACGWDGGDCDKAQPSLLPGELSLVLLVNREKFFRTLHEFLVTLSAHLRASVWLSIDEDKRPKIFEWRSDSGTGEKIDFPMYLDASTFSVLYTGDGAREKRSSANVEGNDAKQSSSILEGVQLIVRLDVTMCNLVKQTARPETITSSSTSALLNRAFPFSHSSFSPTCFTALESVSSYLGAANAKNSLQDLNLPIHSARVLSNRPVERKTISPIAYFFTAFVFVLLLAITVFSVLQGVVKRRRVKYAKTWVPPVVSSQKSMKASTLSLSSICAKDHHLPVHQHQSPNAFTALANHQFCGSNAPLIPNCSGYNPLNSWDSNLVMNNGMSMNHYGGGTRDLFPLQNSHQFLNAYPSMSSGRQSPPTTITTSRTTDSCAASSSGVSSGEGSPDQFHLGVDPLPNLSLHRRAATSEFGVCGEPIDPSLVNQKDPRGQTPLHCLFQNPNFTGSRLNTLELLKNIKELWKRGAHINVQDEEGKTPLIMAITNNNKEVVQALLNSYSADYNLADFNGKSPLYHAIVVLDLQIVQYLIARPNIDLETLARRVETPLMRCALLRSAVSVEIAKLLINKGVKVDYQGDNTFHDYSGRTALHFAASVGNLEMIECLVSNGAQIDVTDGKQEWTPLYLAVNHGQTRAVELLLNLGADKNKQDVNGKPMVKHAKELYFQDIVTLLENSRSPNPLPPQIQVRRQQSSMIYTMPDHQHRSPDLSTSGPQQQSNTLRRDSPGQNQDNKNEPGTKRPRTTNPSKKAVKGAKMAKKVEVSPSSTCPSLLTPPNSDQSVNTYSATPSPSSISLIGSSQSTAAITAVTLQQQQNSGHPNGTKTIMPNSMTTSSISMEPGNGMRQAMASICNAGYATAQASILGTYQQRQQYFHPYFNFNMAFAMPASGSPSTSDNDQQTQLGGTTEYYNLQTPQQQHQQQFLIKAPAPFI